MAIQLGSAYGKISIDSSGVKSGVDSAKQSMGSLEQSAKRLGETMQAVGKFMTTTFTLPLLAAGAASIKYASDLEETRNKVKVVFGEMSDDVLQWGENAALALGQSKQQALEAAGTFGNLFTSMGLGKDASADMSKGLVELAADLASFNNLDPAIVLEKLRSGLVGEVEPLRTLGINLSMAQVQAKAFEMGLADSNGQLSQSALLQARYALILEQSTNAQGDFARTSDGLANQTRILNAQWKDALATLGQHLLPIALQVVQWLNKMLEAFNNLSPGTQKTILAVLGVIAVIGPLLIVLGAIVPMLGRVAGGFNPFSFSIFGLIGTFVKLVSAAAIVVKVLEFFGVATGSVGAGILGLNGAIAGVGASIASIALPILLIVGTLVFLYWAFKNNFGGITTTTQQGWFLVKYYFSQGWAALRTGAAQGLEYLRAGWAAGIADMQVQIDKWVNWLQNAWNNILKYLGDVRNRIVETFRNVDWGAVGMSIINSIANGIFGGIPNLVSAALSAAEQAWNAAQNVFSGTSASSVAASSSASANDVSRSLASSGTVNSRNQSNVTMQFANGVTLRQVQDMLNMNNEAVMKHLNYMLGGA